MRSNDSERETMTLHFSPSGIWLIDKARTAITSWDQLEHLFADDVARETPSNDDEAGKTFANDFIRQVYGREGLEPGKLYEQTVEWLEF
jgi:hypothetical protein